MELMPFTAVLLQEPGAGMDPDTHGNQLQPFDPEIRCS